MLGEIFQLATFPRRLEVIVLAALSHKVPNENGVIMRAADNLEGVKLQTKDTTTVFLEQTTKGSWLMSRAI